MEAPVAGVDDRTSAAEAVEILLRRFPGTDPAGVGIARAPGRVNLIGEHTDYNGGFVLPISLDRATFVAFAPSAGRDVVLWSERMQAYETFGLDAVSPTTEDRWRNYPRGVAAMLQQHGVALRGMHAAVASDVPFGAGVSSSAAFEIAVALALLRVSGEGLDPRELALLCQRAEGEFVGMHCGILDQLASLLGKRDAAVLIDCRSLETTLVPLDESAFAVVVCDTTKPRENVETEYNRRRTSCEQAAAALGVAALRDVGEKRLPEAAQVLNEVAYRRCRHVVTENARVLEAVQALHSGDVEQFGRLVSASHASLRDDYEVSCRELDAMCKLAEATPGCLGARLVGAGFGGCAIAIVRPDNAGSFAAELGPRFEAATGLRPRIFTAHAAPGAGYTSLQHHQ